MPRQLIDITRPPELAGITESREHLRIGAATRLAELEESSLAGKRRCSFKRLAAWPHLAFAVWRRSAAISVAAPVAHPDIACARSVGRACGRRRNSHRAVTRLAARAGPARCIIVSVLIPPTAAAHKVGASQDRLAGGLHAERHRRRGCYFARCGRQHRGGAFRGRRRHHTAAMFEAAAASIAGHAFAELDWRSLRDGW